MSQTIEVVFDGKTFVPTEPVDLPAGTKASVAVAESSALLASAPPPPMTEEQKKDWERLCQLWSSVSLPWATVEEALAYSRGRPWPEPTGEDCDHP